MNIGHMTYAVQIELSVEDLLGEPLPPLLDRVSAAVVRAREAIGPTAWPTGCVADRTYTALVFHLRFEQTDLEHTAEDVVARLMARAQPLLGVRH